MEEKVVARGREERGTDLGYWGIGRWVRERSLKRRGFIDNFSKWKNWRGKMVERKNAFELEGCLAIIVAMLFNSSV